MLEQAGHTPSSRPSKQGAPKREKPEVRFEGNVEETPFTLFLLLIALRFAATIIPFLGGAYLITDFLWPILKELEFTIQLMEFPVWLGFLFTRAILVLATLVWLFTSYDIWRSIQLLGEWERRNVYRLGSYKACRKKGLRFKFALLESWGKTIDLRVRVVRWKTNRAVSSDDYSINPEMAIHYSASQEEPWRTETEVQDFDQFVLTSAEQSMPTIASEFTLKGIQSTEAKLRLKEECQAKIGTLGSIESLAVTDTGIEPETQTALNARATLQAQQKGLREAAQLEEEISDYLLKAAQKYHDAGYNQAPVGQIAKELRVMAFIQASTGGEGKSTWVIPSPVDLFRSIDSGKLDNALKLLSEAANRSSKKEDA